jgi:hypothetical protein
VLALLLLLRNVSPYVVLMGVALTYGGFQALGFASYG